MVSRHLRAHLRNWHTAALPPVCEPLVMLLAFGVGLGQQIGALQWAGAGIDYLPYLAPGILAYTVFSRLTCGCTSKNRGRASSPHRCGWSMSFGGSFCGPPRSPRHTRSSFAVCCCASAGQVLSHCTGHASAGDSDAVSGGACVLLCVGLLFTATLPSIDHMGSPFSLVILPLGFASSTYFPLPDVAWLRDILQFNPLHHLCEGLRWLLLRGEFTSHLGACAGLCGLLILLLVPLDVKLLRKRVFGDT